MDRRPFSARLSAMMYANKCTSLHLFLTHWTASRTVFRGIRRIDGFGEADLTGVTLSLGKVGGISRL